jgi:hypothetical protein
MVAERVRSGPEVGKFEQLVIQDSELVKTLVLVIKVLGIFGTCSEVE